MPLSSLLANLRHAASTGQGAEIGGGLFSPAEIRAALDEVARLRRMAAAASIALEKIQSAEVVLRNNPLASVGNSTIHFALHKTRGAIADLIKETNHV